MYQTQRSQRNFWSQRKREDQKDNRAENINLKQRKVSQKIINDGYSRNQTLHLGFRQRAISRAVAQGLIS